MDENEKNSFNHRFLFDTIYTCPQHLQSKIKLSTSLLSENATASDLQLQDEYLMSLFSKDLHWYDRYQQEFEQPKSNQSIGNSEFSLFKFNKSTSSSSTSSSTLDFLQSDCLKLVGDLWRSNDGNNCDNSLTKRHRNNYYFSCSCKNLQNDHHHHKNKILNVNAGMKNNCFKNKRIKSNNTSDKRFFAEGGSRRNSNFSCNCYNCSPNNKNYTNNNNNNNNRTKKNNENYKKLNNLNNRNNICNKIYNKKFSSNCWNNKLNSFTKYWQRVLSCLAVIIMTFQNMILLRLTAFSHSLSILLSLSSVLSSSDMNGSLTIKQGDKATSKILLTSERRRRRSSSSSSSSSFVYNTNKINCNNSKLFTSFYSLLIFMLIFLTITTTTTTPCVAGLTIPTSQQPLPPPLSAQNIVNAKISPDPNILVDYSINQKNLQQQQQQQQQHQHQEYNHHHYHHQQHHQSSKVINDVYSNVDANKIWANSHFNENLNDMNVNDSNDSGDGDVINNDDDDDDDGDDETDDINDDNDSEIVNNGRSYSSGSNSGSSKRKSINKTGIRKYHYHRRREANNNSGSVNSTTVTTTPVATTINSLESIKIESSNSSFDISSGNSSVGNNSSTLTVTTTKPPPCEPKILEKIPADPLFDVEDICIDAAKEFAVYLSSKSSLSILENSQQQSSSSSASSSSSSSQTSSSSGSSGSELKIHTILIDEIRKKANNIANEALQMDENLLAFAIASPILHIAVVKFRDNVTIPTPELHNKHFLDAYWRELGLAWNNSDGFHEWGAPFRDCNALPGRWLWPYRISVIDSGYKIVATAFIAADTDLCNDNLEDIFGKKHGCDRDTTFCLMTGDPKPSIINRDGYTCICRDSYYLPNSTTQGFRSELVETLTADMENNYTCVPCPGGCFTCDQNGVCLMAGHDQPVSMELLFKASVGSILGACMLCCLVLAIIVFRRRKSKAIATGMWTVLETIVLGILLLYASVALHFLPASTTRCLLEPWCRELGFMTCYGAIILKLYRHLVEFRTRKAHRWVLRDVDLLKYLGTMVFAVICYMSAFTASSIDLIENAELFGLQEVQTNTCVSLKWEYVTQISEMIIICFGLNLAFASRNANTQFRERQFLVAALIIEFIVSSSFYILRVIYLPELSPGAIFLALFIRSQLTNTVTLGLVFLPKLWYQHKQVCSLAHDLSYRLPVDAFKGSHDTGHHLGGGYAGLCLGDPDIGELTISEMSPEDIRAELKRLYTQLEILKNKTLRQDNPHISKRRGGRKAGHRRFSLQKKGSKDKALNSKHRNKHHDIEITEAEPSRTPEDSVCSAEGPTDTFAEVSGISHSMLSHSVLSHTK